ncbi:MAG: hypothetical protein CL902_06830 [Dehalococcoidia bacterium]|nr:hypothetical protein [Dehalococcoidia bacterium]
MDPATDLLKEVLSDLDSLKENGSNSVESASLKGASQLVYRLLVAGNLQKAQTLLRMPGSPQIKTCSLHQAYISDPGRNYAFALAGGAVIDGNRMAGVSVLKEGINLTPPSVPKVATIPLATFLESPGIVINGVPVSRRALIRYAATKLDDPDFDFIADESHEGRLQLLLDSEGARHRLDDTPLAYFELLSIGQAIIHSPNVIRVARRIEKFLNQTSKTTAVTTGE